MSRASQKTVEESILPILPPLLDAHRSTLQPLVGGWRERKRIPPVLLLTGPAGIGKREISYHLSAVFLCARAGFTEGAEGGEDPGPSLFGDIAPSSPVASMEGIDPCWECAACLRAKSGNAIDITEISPEKDSSTLKIDQFREVKESQGFSGYSGKRIFLIPSAERMTNQAANSLLKILEEPPPGWIFLLTTPDPALLPSTVVSRCQAMRMRPLPLEAIRKILQEEGIPSERIALATSLSQGSLLRARDLSTDEVWDRRSLLLKFLIKPQGTLNGLVDWAASSEREFTTLLDQLEQLLFDLLRSLDAEPGKPYPWANLDAVRVLNQHREKLLARGPSEARQFWLGRLESLFSTRRYVGTPLNTKLLVQDLLLPFLEA